MKIVKVLIAVIGLFVGCAEGMKSTSSEIDEFYEKTKEEAIEALKFISHLDTLKQAFNSQKALYGITVTRVLDNGEPLFLDEIALIYACIKLISGQKQDEILQKLSDTLNEAKAKYVKQFCLLYELLSSEKYATSPINKISVDSFSKYNIDFMISCEPSIIDSNNFITKNINIKDVMTAVFEARAREILDIFKLIQLEQKDYTSDWKICIFNEMFFSKCIPLPQTQVKTIIDLWPLSDDDFRLILCMNFLYTYKNNQLPQINSMGTALKDKFYSKSHLELVNYLNTISTMQKTNSSSKSQGYNYLVNANQFLWNKRNICFYKKSSYCSENDDLLRQGYIYDVGDGFNHKYDKLTTEEGQIADLILNNISSEICFDLCCGIRKNNVQANAVYKKNFHILTSNWVSIYTNLHNLPLNGTLILHVDPILLNENVFSLRKDMSTSSFNSHKHNITPVFELTGESLYIERLRSTLDTSRLIKNNPMESIRLKFGNRQYIIQMYDLRDAFLKMRRGY